VKPHKPFHERLHPAVTDNGADNGAEEDEVLTLSGSARRLDMPASIVSRWARSGRIPTANAQGPLMFRPEDLDAASLKRDDPAGPSGPTERPSAA